MNEKVFWSSESGSPKRSKFWNFLKRLKRASDGSVHTQGRIRDAKWCWKMDLDLHFMGKRGKRKKVHTEFFISSNPHRWWFGFCSFQCLPLYFFAFWPSKRMLRTHLRAIAWSAESKSGNYAFIDFRFTWRTLQSGAKHSPQGGQTTKSDPAGLLWCNFAKIIALSPERGLSGRWFQDSSSV